MNLKFICVKWRPLDLKFIKALLIMNLSCRLSRRSNRFCSSIYTINRMKRLGNIIQKLQMKVFIISLKKFNWIFLQEIGDERQKVLLSYCRDAFMRLILQTLVLIINLSSALCGQGPKNLSVLYVLLKEKLIST